MAYHVLKDPETPVRAKVTLGGALAYLVMPLDAIPDLLPGVGYTDDVAAVVAALVAVSASIHKRHHDLARQSLNVLFGREDKAKS